MAGTFDARVEGLDRLLADLRDYPEQAARAVAAALFREAEETVTDAKRLTPVDEGVLRSSGHVRPPVYSADGVDVEAGFGGPAGAGNRGETNPEDVGYALIVHEDLTAHHAVGQAKYLEAPLNRRRSGVTARVIRRVRAVMGRPG